jgi:hypothetical protein
MHRRLAAADRPFMDETTAPVLDAGRCATKKGYFYFWSTVSDDRGHGVPGPPIVLFRCPWPQRLRRQFPRRLQSTLPAVRRL